MTNLIETPLYEPGIFQIETTTPVNGGQPAIVDGSPVAGHSNAQALQLANRTGYLKEQVDGLAVEVSSKRFEGTASDDSGTPDAVFKVVRTHSLATSPHGFRDQTTFNPSAPAVAAACFDAALESIGSQNIDHTIGFQARLTHSGSGTITNLYGGGSFNIINGPVSNAYAYYAQDRANVAVGLMNGAYFRPAIFANVTNAYGFVHAPAINSGTVTNSIGFRVETADGAGSLTNEYGLYIKALTKGTNKHPLYIETTSGDNYIGTKTQHDALFQVGGSARLSVGGATGSAFPQITYNYDPVLNQYIATTEASGFLWSGTNFSFRHALSGTAGTTPTFSTLLNIRTTNDANYKAVFAGADNAQQLGLSTVRWAQTYSREFRPGSGAPIWTSGVGTPEGVVTAPIGSMFTRTDGGANTTLYVKESGASNTGWVAK
jgi:hypothetical protein